MEQTPPRKPTKEDLQKLMEQAANLRARNPDEVQGYMTELLAVMGAKVVELHQRVESLEAEVAKLRGK